jgi:hypothetical protein
MASSFWSGSFANSSKYGAAMRWAMPRFAIIDFNDWPSFSCVRCGARAIARGALKLLARPRTAAGYPWLK